MVYPRRKSEWSFWANAKAPKYFCQPLFFVYSSVFFNWILFYERFVIQKKVLVTDAVKSVYVEYRFVITRRNNNENSNNEYDLP